ncbi:hypothetical protein T03_17390 [Trichinella britovi]|uniref:Uncharacterized protein n=1 Tax=Trichinella britovi TaxID=45882 RepID=A0A0V1C5I6_TRIBR|nr:hypothetical protein T03_17390 [Trichinella britovi]
MAKFTRLVPPQKTTSISILLCNPLLKVHLSNVGLQVDTVRSESQEGLEQVDLQLAVQGSVRIALNHQKQLGTSSPCPHLGIQRGPISLEPFLPSRSPRIDASSLHTPAFPLRSAPVCARQQASDVLLAENYLAARAVLGAKEDGPHIVHRQTKAPPRIFGAPPGLVELFGCRWQCQWLLVPKIAARSGRLILPRESGG